MGKIIINQEKCKGCLLCLEVCPRHLIVKDTALNSRGVSAVKFTKGGKCVGCSLCAIICPDCCIEVYK